MNKKLLAFIVGLAVAMTCFAVYVGVNGTGRPTHYFRVSADRVTRSSDASQRLAALCCGSDADAEISLGKSAFHMDFVPQEPEYVERFRHYQGVKAEFVPVLMYHFFYDANVDVPTKGNNSHSIQSVNAQLQWLWENGYVTLTMDELYEWLNESIELPAKCVLITSDDGQDNFFDLLQPLLHKYGFVATSFVITSHRKNIPYKLTLPNVELHCHTHNMHRGSVPKSVGYPTEWGMMQGVSVKEGVADITTCREILDGSQYFAYPYGNFGGNSKEILAQSGIRMAFTTQGGTVRRGQDFYELPRQRISGSLEVGNFSRLLHYDSVTSRYQSE